MYKAAWEIVSLYNDAIRRRLLSFRIAKSKSVEAILNSLLERGYIKHLEKSTEIMEVFLRWDGDSPVHRLEAISTNRMAYPIKYNKLTDYLNSYSDILVSTDRGLCWSDSLNEFRLGGKVLLRVSL